MTTLQNFLTASAVAAGSGDTNLGPALRALDAYVANFEGDAQRNALVAAKQAVSIIKLEGSVESQLSREIEARISRSPSMSL